MYLSEVQSGQKLRKRRFYSPYLGEVQGSTSIEPGIDMARAVLRNRDYAQRLGWGTQFNRIAQLVGFRDRSPDEASFVQAVARWQTTQPGLSVDGIIGPNTWKVMRTMISPAPSAPAQPLQAGGSAAQLAARILNHPNLTLATVHVSGMNDNATARQNIIDTSNGLPASRSNYSNAPGGAVQLDARLLNGILRLADQYRFAISEIAGGSHSRTSRHYAGIAMDVNVINGQRVNARHPDVQGFMRACRDLGATEVLGPGDPDHDTHIHCAWPRR